MLKSKLVPFSLALSLAMAIAPGDAKAEEKDAEAHEILLATTLVVAPAFAVMGVLTLFDNGELYQYKGPNGYEYATRSTLATGYGLIAGSTLLAGASAYFLKDGPYLRLPTLIAGAEVSLQSFTYAALLLRDNEVTDPETLTLAGIGATAGILTLVYYLRGEDEEGLPARFSVSQVPSGTTMGPSGSF